MVKKKEWQEFQNTGLLLIINQILHIFGWAIVLEYENYGTKKQEIIRVYPARVKFRGFKGDCVDESYKNIQNYLNENIESLNKDFEG